MKKGLSSYEAEKMKMEKEFNLKCKGKNCNNKVEKGWCLICQCKFHGYDAIGRFETGKMVGLILQREDLK